MKLNEFQFYKSWLKLEDKNAIWKEFFKNDYSEDIANCLNDLFRYLETLDEIDIDITYIFPIVTRMLIIIKGETPGCINKKLSELPQIKTSPDYEFIIKYIIDNMNKKITYYVDKYPKNFDYDAEACSDIAKELASYYNKSLRKNKLQRLI